MNLPYDVALKRSASLPLQFTSGRVCGHALAAYFAASGRERRHLPLPTRLAALRPIPKGLHPPAQGCEARATLGEVVGFSLQPQRGCSSQVGETQPRWGWRVLGRRRPRVASPTRQPWALGRNPVGIQQENRPNLWVRQRPAHAPGLRGCPSAVKCLLPAVAENQPATQSKTA